MSDFTPREITIGDSTYKVVRFKGLKAAIVGALMSRVLRERPQLQERANEFRKEYREKNTIVITPAMAKLPTFAALGLTAEDFEAAGGKIEFPEDPQPQMVVTSMFPDMMEMALRELQMLMAVIVIPNSELEEADDADMVDEALAKLGKRLFRQGDIDELIELTVVGLEVIQEQMASKRERLGKVQIPMVQNWLNQILPQEEEAPEELVDEVLSNGHGQTLPTPTDEMPSQSANSAPPLSIVSHPDLDGQEEMSSTESLGTN